MSSDGWVELCALDDMAVGEGRYVVHDGRAVAVLRVTANRVRVMDDACPHAGGSLSAGQIDADGGCVFCPWHGWPFDLETGRCPDNEAFGVQTYPVRIHQGRVLAKLSDDGGPATDRLL